MTHPLVLIDMQDDAALRHCFPVFHYLRPHLDAATFVDQAKQQAAQGYRIVCLQHENEVVAAAGFRQATFLAWGKLLYVDDLITHPEKKRAGYGSALLDWLIAEGQRRGCDQIHLDTGHQRHDAHRLYLNKGFVLSSHHMSRTLSP